MGPARGVVQARARGRGVRLRRICPAAGTPEVRAAPVGRDVEALLERAARRIIKTGASRARSRTWRRIPTRTSAGGERTSPESRHHGQHARRFHGATAPSPTPARGRRSHVLAVSGEHSSDSVSGGRESEARSPGEIPPRRSTKRLHAPRRNVAVERTRSRCAGGPGRATSSILLDGRSSPSTPRQAADLLRLARVSAANQEWPITSPKIMEMTVNGIQPLPSSTIASPNAYGAAKARDPM